MTEKKLLINGNLKWIMALISGLVIVATAAYISHVETALAAANRAAADSQISIAAQSEKANAIDARLTRIENKLDRLIEK